MDVSVARVSGLLRDLLSSDITPSEEIIPLSSDHVTPVSLDVVVRWCANFISEHRWTKILTTGRSSPRSRRLTPRDIELALDAYTESEEGVFRSHPHLNSFEKELFATLPTEEVADVMVAADYMGVGPLVDHLSYWLYEVMKGRSVEYQRKLLLNE